MPVAAVLLSVALLAPGQLLAAVAGPLSYPGQACGSPLTPAAVRRGWDRAQGAGASQPLSASWPAQLREQEPGLLTDPGRLAAVQAQELGTGALTGMVGVLLLGLAAGAISYGHLRRQQTLLARAYREASAAVAEKEVLVQEIHHRVKNNLQIVSSLLSWQGSRTTDPALGEVLRSSQARIHCMALVHELLFRSPNLAQLRLDVYLAELLKSLHQFLNSAQQPIHLTTELEAVLVEAKEASAWGLLVNELVTNAYKHAFCELQGGHLRISLSQRAGSTGLQLLVRDDGRGLPDGGLVGRPESLGLSLVSSLARQLRATVTATANRPRGTCVAISRP